MSSLVIFLTVIIAVSVPKYAAASVNVPDVDIAKLLDLVQPRLNRRISSDSSDSSDSDSSDSSDDSRARSGRVGENDIVNLIRQAIKNRSDNKINHDHKPNKEKPRNVARVLKYDKSDSKHEHFHNDEIAHVLNQLLSNSLKKPESKFHPTNKAPKKRVIPSRLLWDAKDTNVDGNGLDEYSKIYIVLNPQAVQKTKNNKSAINQLISRVLSLSSLPTNRSQKPKRYKGFAIKERAARRRGSREMYAPDGSMEDRPMKRGRNSGGSNGRTAIPYIRHRGENIYEKDD